MIDPNMSDEQEQAEIKRRLRDIAESETQRKAESRQFQDELREQLGLPAKPRGGARPGAGRKPKWQKPSTTVMRVPEQYAGIVRALILHLDETQDIRRGYAPATSERLPTRSITGRAQYVQFTVLPRDEPREIQSELNL